MVTDNAPDVAFDDCTPELIRERIIEHGYVVLRAVTAKQKLTSFRTHWIEPALKWYHLLSDDELALHVKDSWWGMGGSQPFHRTQRDHGFLSEGILQDYSEGAASLYDLLSEPRVHFLINQAFPSAHFRKSRVSLCRRIMPGKRPTGWADSVEFHIDLRYHEETLFALNFWTPFDPAGAMYSSPALEIADMGMRDVANWLEFKGDQISHRGTFNQSRFDYDSFVHSRWSRRLRTPELDVGDILVFSNWTLHRTYVPDNATASRMSAEIRFVGESSVTREALGSGFFL